jgi:SAM-dependent methyltransferase
MQGSRDDRLRSNEELLHQGAPFCRGLHFPAAEEAVGDLNNKRVLDIGCGDGLFPRLLAQRGASAVGYDKAPEKIAEARAHEDARQLDATLLSGRRIRFRTFHAATSIMVLQFAISAEELAAFFCSASRHLGSVLNLCSRLLDRPAAVHRAGRQQSGVAIPRSDVRPRGDGGGRLILALVRRLRTGRSRRRNEPAGMEETSLPYWNRHSFVGSRRGPVPASRWHRSQS